MIRLSFGLLLVAVFLVIAIALIGEPGVAHPSCLRPDGDSAWLSDRPLAE